MKVGFVITNHFSKYRPGGRKYLYELLKSIKNSIHKDIIYNIYIIDNASEKNIKDEFKDEKYFYIEDQSVGGISYAWNFGIKIAIDDNCDIIINLNDDLIINESINKFIQIIDEHPEKNISLFGPTSNGAPDHQTFHGYKDKILETSGLDYGDQKIKDVMKGYPLNGFALGFTREMYHNFNIDGWLFSRDIRDVWSNQETEFYMRNKPKGLKNYIIYSCYIVHHKAYTYKEARKRFNGIGRDKSMDYSHTILCEKYKI